MENLLARTLIWLVVVVVVLVLAEVVWRVRSGRGFNKRTALTTLGLAAGNVPAAVLNGILVGAVFAGSWQIAPVHWPQDEWKTWVAGFVVVEFAY